MNRTLLTLLAASAIALPAAAFAQPGWQSINQRQAGLDQRIDAGVRSGDLTRDEAARLRTDFNGLSRLEANYRASAPGLTPDEVRDLDRRFDDLSARIRVERNDPDRRGDGRGGANWQTINQRQADLDRRIDQGVRSGDLTRDEAARLRTDFNGLASLEANYRASAPGLTQDEVRDLDRRFDALSARIRIERNDPDRRGDRGGPGWQTINERQADLDRRIDTGVREGDLTRDEAARLRMDFNGLARLEASYRASAPGLTQDEVRDLDRRFDDLSVRIRDQRRDDDRAGGRDGGRGGWSDITDRRVELDRAIDRAYANHRITRTVARRLHTEAAALIRIQTSYRNSRPGLTREERADLDRRADLIAKQVGSRVYGSGYGR